MAIFARSDVMSVSIPAAHGGCNQTHTRPVRNGAPAKTWKLDCLPCEQYLKGARKPKILKVTPGDPKAGIPPRQERVADADPHWSSTPDSVPLTPDEIQSRHLKIEKGEQQLRALESLLTLKAGGVDFMSRPEVLYYLQESGLTEEMLQGKIVCPDGHDNTAGAKFCAECGAGMNGRTPAAEIAPVIPLDTLHVATIRKMCRDKGLPDKGSKTALIASLEAA